METKIKQIYINNEIICASVSLMLESLKVINVELQSIALSDTYKNALYVAKDEIEEALNIQGNSIFAQIQPKIENQIK